jgi:hypothetical protein
VVDSRSATEGLGFAWRILIGSPINIRISRTEAKLAVRRIRHHYSSDDLANGWIVSKKLEWKVIRDVHDVDHADNIWRRRKKCDSHSPRTMARYARRSQPALRQSTRRYHSIHSEPKVISLNVLILSIGICHSKPASPDVVAYRKS